MPALRRSIRTSARGPGTAAEQGKRDGPSGVGMPGGSSTLYAVPTALHRSSIGAVQSTIGAVVLAILVAAFLVAAALDGGFVACSTLGALIGAVGALVSR